MTMLLTALVLAQTAAPAIGMRVAPAAGMRVKMDKGEPVCVRATDPPPAFAKWNAVPAKTLAVGAPFVMTASAAVKWAVPPGKPGKGAVARFEIVRAGVYQVGLGNGAWIDLVAKGRAVESVAHGHGPVCTGLRKVVDFKLVRGSYVLQLSSMPADTTKVMVVRK